MLFNFDIPIEGLADETHLSLWILPLKCHAASLLLCCFIHILKYV